MTAAWERVSAVFLEKPPRYRLESGPCPGMPALLLLCSDLLGVLLGSDQEAVRKSISICIFTGPEGVSVRPLSQCKAKEGILATSASCHPSAAGCRSFCTAHHPARLAEATQLLGVKWALCWWSGLRRHLPLLSGCWNGKQFINWLDGPQIKAKVQIQRQA